MSKELRPEILRYEVESGGERLDKYLASVAGILTRTHVQKLIREGNIRLNGQSSRASYVLRDGDRIEVTLLPPESSELVPEDIPVEIIYEDNCLAVIDKPAGLAVYPAPGHDSHTLANALLRRFPDLCVFGNSKRPGIVHRLDKDTSGLMVIARSEAVRLDLEAQFKLRSVTKKYIVLVMGRLTPENGVVEAPIGRDPSNRKRMAIVSSGRPARTEYRVKKYIRNYSLLEVHILTGRTHQIRVHMSAIGHPVAGDKVYGGSRPSFFPRQFLHASSLEFRLPGTGQRQAFTCPLPEDLDGVLKGLQVRGS